MIAARAWLLAVTSGGSDTDTPHRHNGTSRGIEYGSRDVARPRMAEDGARHGVREISAHLPILRNLGGRTHSRQPATFLHIFLASHWHRRCCLLTTMNTNHRSSLGPDTRIALLESTVVGSLVVLLMAACTTTELDARRAEPAGIAAVPTHKDSPTSESGLVDCLLPAEVRKIGSRFVYLAPRRSIRTSMRECEIRGGTAATSWRGAGSSAASGEPTTTDP